MVIDSIFRRLSKKTKTPVCKVLALGSPRLLVEETKVLNLSILDKNDVFSQICRDRHPISTSTKKNKQAKAIFQFYFISNYLDKHLIKKRRKFAK